MVKRRPSVALTAEHPKKSNGPKRGATELCLGPPEQLTLGTTKRTSKKWDQEFDALVLPLLEDDVPCYILYRLDSSNNQGHEWILLAYSPDKSSVRSSARPWLPLLGGATTSTQRFCLAKLVIMDTSALI